MWKRIFLTLAVFFLIFSVLHNPEFTASAIRSGWSWLRSFVDALGRVYRSV